MEHLSNLRKTFNLKSLDFHFDISDPHYDRLLAFQREQLALVKDMPDAGPRPEGTPSDTYLHSRRVAEDVYTFARYIGLREHIANNLRFAVSLHDIGKLDVPVEILSKAGKLTDEEFAEMKRHTEHGVNRLKSIGLDNHPMIKLACDIAKFHHERNDGKGYYGLKEQDIPSRVRLVQLCDIYDAVSAPRVYRTEKEQLTPYDTMKNILDTHGFLYGAVDQRFAIPFCLLKMNLLEGDLSKEHHKMLERYVLEAEPFHDDRFWPSADEVRIVD